MSTESDKPRGRKVPSNDEIKAAYETFKSIMNADCSLLLSKEGRVSLYRPSATGLDMITTDMAPSTFVDNVNFLICVAPHTDLADRAIAAAV